MQFFLELLASNLSVFSKRLAFHIDSVDYTYSDLSERIAAIQQFIKEVPDQQYFGVVARSSIDTYAAIFALWFLGKTSVPLGAKNPYARNSHIVKQVGISTVFDSLSEQMVF